MVHLIEPLMNLGLPGIIIGALLIWVSRLHTNLEQVHAARIEDAKAFTERSLALQEGVHKTIIKLEVLADMMARDGREGGSIHDG